MEAAPLPQSEQFDSVPYITVRTDDRGSACWAVVGHGVVVRAYSGHRAMAILQMMCAASGLLTPDP